MEFTTFEEANLILAENQEEFLSLPVNLNPVDPTQPMTFQVQFSPVDIGRLKQNGGRAFFTQSTYGNNFQPVSVSLEAPHTLSDLTKEEVVKILTERAEQKAQEEAARKRLPVRLAPFKMADGTEKLLPIMGNGDYIPQIAQGTLALDWTPEEYKAGLGRLKMELFINLADLDGLNLVKLFPGEIKGTM